MVLTSSSGACTAPKPNKVFTIDSNTWNEESVAEAWKPPPYEGFERKLAVYYASKTQGEQAAWKFMKERSPHFVLNTVLPNANFGSATDSAHQGHHSTLGWLEAAYNNFAGQEDIIEQPPQYFINIEDDAAVHIAALIYGDVKNERLFAFAYPYNWNDVLASFRKLYPNRKYRDDIPGQGRDLSKVANERAEELLKRLTGHGWTSLEDTIKQTVDSYV